MTEVRCVPAKAVFACPSCGCELSVPGYLHDFAVRFSEGTAKLVALEHALGEPERHRDLFDALDADDAVAAEEVDADDE